MATLGEGNTPLIPSITARGLSFKLENCNLSGSYKDRFIAAEVTRLLSIGARACVATSSGNTGAALAAYCARYEIRAVILVNQDAPAGKLQQMQAHGAQVLRIPHFAANPEVTTAVFETLLEFSRERAVPLVVSAYHYCPEGMRGVERIAQEFDAPDHLFVPVGSGGLYAAVIRGFAARGGRMPRVHAVQPAGCLTVVASALRGDDEVRPVVSTTKVSGLSVPMDIDGSLALSLLREYGGSGISVRDEEIWRAQQWLLEREGIYAEPAGAAAFAGWQQAVAAGTVRESEHSICLVTGHGFKDPVSVALGAERHPDRTVEVASLTTALREVTC